MANRKDSKIFINRELSWLEFNRRVLDLSREKSVPLGEQLNFASIYVSNLDEFIMVRVGSLSDQALLHKEITENKTGMTPKQQLKAIFPKIRDLQGILDKNVSKLYKNLEEHNLHKVDFEKLDKKQLSFWKKYFLSELFPVLSPQIVDRRHPFPFLRNLDIYVGAMIQEKKGAEPVFGLIPINSQFDRLLITNDGEKTYFAFVEDLVLFFADIAFGNTNIVEKVLFRVTRNADINVEEGMFDHDIDYREVMSELLKRRRKLAAIRIQFSPSPSDMIQKFLLEKLVLTPEHVFVQSCPLDLSVLPKIRKRLQAQGKPELFYNPVKTLPMLGQLEDDHLLDKRDVLLCYPYHQAMRPFIRMLYMAAKDPNVVSIKMTLYRVASESQIIDALIAAAENGKEVVTVVELRARFDEQNNIDWSRQLEQAGCTVIYGFSDYKVHAKVTLITRKVESNYEYITSIGTGNYNEKTSELYTDLHYLTQDKEIGEEAAALFNNLAMERLTDHVSHLIVAPLHFKSVLIEEMEEEIRQQNMGKEGRIVIKCNSISDKLIIETLSNASQADVPVDLIVRGICCLQTGLPGLTDNIRVRSLVGRYLEHSRIYAFGSGDRLRVYIASGDFLTRNTERRVEVGIRIDDPLIKQMLCDILDMQLKDTLNASIMGPDGVYIKVKPEKGQLPFDSQIEMYPYLERKLQSTKAKTSRASVPSPKPVAATPPAPKRSFINRIKRVFGK